MIFARETDPMLRRFERNQVLVCAVLALVAAVAGRPDFSVGIVGGSLLMALGYVGIKALVNVLTTSTRTEESAESARSRPRRRVWAVVKFASHYALLALAAYVMLIRLHLHPLGVLLGASTPVISAAIEGATAARRLPRAGHHPK